MRHPVLITGVGGNIGQGIIKALRASRYPFRIIGVDMEPLSAGFSLVDRYEYVPRTGHPGFEETLKKLALEEKLEAIYVCSPTELGYFSSRQKALESELGLKIFVNPPEVCRIGEDKLESVRFLERGGFPFPATCLANDLKGVERLVSQCDFPLIVKPRRGFTSTHVFKVNSWDEIEALKRVIPDLVVQQFLPDAEGEYTAGTISGSEGKVRACIVLRRHLLQGTTYRSELLMNPAVTNQVIRIVETLGAVGVCNPQFCLVEKKVMIFEINPRFSGTSGIRYLYGFNDPEMMFEIFRLKREVSQPELRPAVVLRYWNEVCLPGADFQTLREGARIHDGAPSVLSPLERGKEVPG